MSSDRYVVVGLLTALAIKHGWRAISVETSETTITLALVKGEDE